MIWSNSRFITVCQVMLLRLLAAKPSCKGSFSLRQGPQNFRPFTFVHFDRFCTAQAGSSGFLALCMINFRDYSSEKFL
ncbi:hypothetical protein M758_2G226600 [Ceratodon purpureus]|nr:hypothetical protein M758_2G226600 [Ceratodon purpureus]